MHLFCSYMLKAYFLLTWSHKRPNSFFAASLPLYTYISFSKDLLCVQCAALICPSYKKALFNGCVRYADHKKQDFYIVFTNCTPQRHIILACPVVTLLIFLCIASKPFTCSFIIIMNCWVWMLTKMQH